MKISAIRRPRAIHLLLGRQQARNLVRRLGTHRKGKPSPISNLSLGRSRYAGDRVPVKATVESIVIASSGDLAYTAGLQRGPVCVDGSREQEMVIRVTHIFVATTTVGSSSTATPNFLHLISGTVNTSNRGPPDAQSRQLYVASKPTRSPPQSRLALPQREQQPTPAWSSLILRTISTAPAPALARRLRLKRKRRHGVASSVRRDVQRTACAFGARPTSAAADQAIRHTSTDARRGHSEPSRWGQSKPSSSPAVPGRPTLLLRRASRRQRRRFPFARIRVAVRAGSRRGASATNTSSFRASRGTHRS